jgi:hypothetical protein
MRKSGEAPLSEADDTLQKGTQGGDEEAGLSVCIHVPTSTCVHNYFVLCVIVHLK